MYSPPNSPGATPASAAAGKENPSRLGESIWKGDVSGTLLLSPGEQRRLG